MSKKQELESTVLLESYDIVAETWWDEYYEWSAAIDGYKLFRRDRKRRRGREVALYVKEWIECEDMSLKNSQEEVKSLWVLSMPGTALLASQLSAELCNGRCTLLAAYTVFNNLVISAKTMLGRTNRVLSCLWTFPCQKRLCQAADLTGLA
ncbi:hypothetical protein llap_16594 [Limosa lapponica baueri]|uniref:Uncharacterized protein n=1 Tax=Limosa lapponica baueri TaxID=1758121 RepID=A0A2I0TH17_LIMLA|nr:hypothetical protein llap_16594 [Limosa lapponica baueri]